MGHEFSGVVYAVGEKRGRHQSRPARRGRTLHHRAMTYRPEEEAATTTSLKDMNFIGLGGCSGGLSEKIAVKRRWVHPISDKSRWIKPL